MAEGVARLTRLVAAADRAPRRRSGQRLDDALTQLRSTILEVDKVKKALLERCEP